MVDMVEIINKYKYNEHNEKNISKKDYYFTNILILGSFNTPLLSALNTDLVLFVLYPCTK